MIYHTGANAVVDYQHAVLPLNITLRLGPVRDASSLFNPNGLASVLEGVADEFTPVVTRQEFRRAKRADEIFQGFDDSIRSLIAKLIAPDETRENVFENKDVLEAKTGHRECQQITHNMIEDPSRDDGLEWSDRLRNLRPQLIADTALLDSDLDIFRKGGPDRKPLHRQHHLVDTWMTGPLGTMEISENLGYQLLGYHRLQDVVIDGLRVGSSVQDTITDHQPTEVASEPRTWE